MLHRENDACVATELQVDSPNDRRLESVRCGSQAKEPKGYLEEGVVDGIVLSEKGNAQASFNRKQKATSTRNYAVLICPGLSTG